jgi:hypothetical protein
MSDVRLNTLPPIIIGMNSTVFGIRFVGFMNRSLATTIHRLSDRVARIKVSEHGADHCFARVTQTVHLDGCTIRADQHRKTSKHHSSDHFCVELFVGSRIGASACAGVVRTQRVYGRVVG